MKNIAFIPVRGGSKSIPLKNIKELCGKPLVYWTLKAACESEWIDKVFVSTDSDQIQSVVEKIVKDNNLFSKTRIVKRSAETSSDSASTESAMIEFAERHDFVNMILIQATSPLLFVSDINRGFEIFFEDGTDSVLSVVRQKRFNWIVEKNGFAKPSNYNVFNRPRRQEFEGYFVENGAFYITSKEALLRYNSRLSGNIRICEMDEDSYFEIDEIGDWDIIEAILSKKSGQL